MAGGMCAATAPSQRASTTCICWGCLPTGRKKGPDSVKWGVRFLSEEVEEIVIDPARCPATKREFYGYELELDREGAPMARYPDRDNHSIDAVRYALEDAIRAGYRERRRTWRFQG